MQVINTDPTLMLNEGSNHRVNENIYCIGDTSLTQINEEKGVLSAKMGAEIAAANILESLRGGRNFMRIPL
jgi:hypothetical protein